ncbi:PIG-L deacetylase family protein [Devosia ginsengisoli]|uniref:PIG-L deacetylase family protein n=1 Tax=Devosia ginsengisoli TaxID=400770 RepID=UPI0026EAF75B|nr:PIG-L deacetylase family protein [Devosia ginsengisoli]MCR6672047.1 PIG-L family deacetylase [Devosia ginsengisoli]
MTQNVLVIAAHPDDEVLGCGGTIAKYVRTGAVVNVAFLADGVYSRAQVDDAELIRRQQAARTALRILGANAPSFGAFPDNRMDSVPLLDIIKSVEQRIDEYQPDLVLTHHAGDVNVDHRLIHEAITAACRPQAGHPVKSLRFFEVASSTEWQIPGSAPTFAPTWFEDISATFEAKMAALDAYAMEMRAWPHPRSMEGVAALARWRGATIGVDAAEAFVLGRHLA